MIRNQHHLCSHLVVVRVYLTNGSILIMLDISGTMSPDYRNLAVLGERNDTNGPFVELGFRAKRHFEEY